MANPQLTQVAEHRPYLIRIPTFVSTKNVKKIKEKSSCIESHTFSLCSDLF